jgi:hypothetical protein
MVGEVSGHNAQFIMREMPYARSLQFRTIWYDTKGIAWKVIGDNEESLKKIIS